MVQNGAQFSGFSLTPNTGIPGQVLISQFGVSAVTETNGELLVIQFDVKATAPVGSHSVVLQTLDFGTDAATIPVTVKENGAVIVADANVVQIVINEVSPDNQSVMDDDGDSFNWLELYNTGGQPVVLTNTQLGYSGSTYVMPNVTIGPGGYLLLFLSGKDKVDSNVHANFLIPNGSGLIEFRNYNAAIIDAVTYQPQLPDQTYGRFPNGTGAFQTLSPSPAAENVTGDPMIVPIGNQTVAVGNTLSFTVTATDPTMDPLTMTISGLPVGASYIDLGGGTGQFAWTPANGQQGAYPVTFTAQDNQGGSSSEMITITVTDAVNRPPVLTPIGDRTVNVQETLSFVVVATDPDGDFLTYPDPPEGLPAGATLGFNPVGKLFSWTPTDAFIGDTALTFRADDGNGGVASETVTITVVGLSNQAPTLDMIGNKNTMEGATLTFGVSGSDPDGDPTTISITAGQQGWMSFDGTTFTGTPDFNDAGVYDVTFQISDGSLTDSETISISVGNVNRDPVLASIGNKSVDENSTLSFGVSASDPDGDTVTITTSALQSWMSFNGTTFTGIPGNSDAGTYQVIFTAIDGNGGADTETVTITVNEMNNPPVMNPVSNQTLEETESLTVGVSASDPDGDAVTITFSGTEPWMSFDGSTLSLSPMSGDAGTYPVSFTAQDPGLLTDTVNFTITVTPLQINSAPVLDPVGDQSVDEGQSVMVTLSASDPDGDTVTIDVTGLRSWMNFSGNTLTLSPGFTDAGTYMLTVIADDGELTDAETITVTVNDANQAPVLDPVGDQTVDEGQMATVNFSGSDPDGDAVSFQVTGLQAWMSFSGNTLTLSPGFEDAGTYLLTVIADDGDLTDEEMIMVTVIHVNRPPVLTPIGDQSIDEGETGGGPIEATDPDGDPLTFSITGAPAWLSLVGDTVTAAPGFDDAGTYPVTVIVSDGELTDEESLTLTVVNVNRAPVLDNIGNQSVPEGGNLSFIVTSSDPDGDSVTVTTGVLETWMSFDGSTFTANPQIGDAGNYQVTFTTSDGDLTDQETITVSVGDVNQAPNLTPTGDQFVNEGQTLNVSVSATDPDGDMLTYSATNLQSWMSFSGSLLTLSPGFADAGTYMVTVTASDGLLQDSEEITVTVFDINRAPVLGPVGDQTIDEGSTKVINLNGSDPDGDSLTFEVTGIPAWMSLNGSVLSLAPGFDDAGTYPLTVTVSDGDMSHSENITVTVNNTNRAPDLAPIGNQSVAEGDPLIVAVSATDPDGDTVTVTIGVLETWMSFDGSHFTANPQSGDAGNYQVTFTASDGDLTDEETITVSVGGVNQAPELTPTGDQFVDEGQTLNVSVSATDPDGDMITYEATNLQPWMSFNGNLLTLTPGFTDAGIYMVTISATDGALQDSEDITVTVNDINRAPELASIGPLSVPEGDSLTVGVSATDPDGDTVTIAAGGLETWMSFDGASFTANPQIGDSGSYQVTFTASDGDLSDEETITVSVGAVNQAPVLDPIGDQSTDEGNILEVTIAATDPDGDAITFSLENAPAWITLVGSTLSITPGFDDAGTYMVTVIADDGELQDSETIAVSVGDVNRGPQLDSLSDITLLEGETGSFVVAATDPDGDSLSITATGLTIWMNFIGNEFSAQPQGGDAGVYDIGFEVTDGEFTDSATVRVTVLSDSSNMPPVLNPIGNKTVTEGEMLMFTVSGAQAGGGPLWFSAENLPEGAAFDPDAQKFSWQTEKGDAGSYNVTFIVDDGNGGQDSEVITIVVAIGDFVLNAENFPYHQALNNGTDPVEKFSGAAVLKMLLQYIWWNRFDDPAGPPELTDPQLSMQELLYQFAQPLNYPINQGLPRIDGWGMWMAIQDLDPPYNPFHYNFGLKSRDSLEEALNDIAKWLAYPAGGGSDNPNGHGVDGYPVYVPGAVPLYGNYDHWVVIKGIRSTVDPWNNSDFGICGFWINDPHPQGLGENTFVTAEQFTSMYYKPLTDIDPDDPLYNRYIALLEPPLTEKGDVSIVISRPRLKIRVHNFFQLKSVEMEDGTEQQVYVRDSLDKDAFNLIEAAIAGIQEQLLPYDEEFAALFAQTIPRKPIFVESRHGNYYLVPFELPLTEEEITAARANRKTRMMIDDDGNALSSDMSEGSRKKERRKERRQLRKRTVIVALIDADSGAFREVTWVKEPLRYLPVGKRKALRLLARYLNPHTDRKSRRGAVRQLLHGAEMELIHTEGSFYYPVWRIYFEGQTYLVDQGNSVSPIAHEE